MAKIGYRKLAEWNVLTLAFCWPHVRRRFYELAANGPAPLASEALARIAGLYRIEAEVPGKGAEKRHDARRTNSKQVLDALKLWLREKLLAISQETKLAEASPQRPVTVGRAYPLRG